MLFTIQYNKLDLIIFYVFSHLKKKMLGFNVIFGGNYSLKRDKNSDFSMKENKHHEEGIKLCP